MSDRLTHRARDQGAHAPARWPLLALTGCLVIIVSCSNLLDNSAFSPCAGDSDCPVGEQCNIQLGGLCEPEPQGLPPRAVLGFVVEDPVLGEEVELLACDDQVAASTAELSVLRSHLFQILRVDYKETVEAIGGVCPSDYQSETATPTLCTGIFPADIVLTQPSRLGRPPLSTSGAFVPNTSESEADNSVGLVWPRSFGTQAELPLVLSVADGRDEDEPGEFSRSLIRSTVHRADAATVATDLPLFVTGRKRCHRRLTGNVRTFMGGLPAEEQRVELLFGEPVASMTTVLPKGQADVCITDNDCESGEACNTATGSCGLDLRDVVAASTVSPPQGSFEMYVYNHCEENSQPTALSFEARYGPLGGSPAAPTMYAAFDQPLDIGLIGDPLPKTDALQADLCLPSWPALSPVAITVLAPPVTVIEGSTSESTWTCCTIDDCFAGSSAIGEQTPAEPPGDCGGFSTMSLSTNLLAEELPFSDAEWAADGCLPLSPREDGAVGRHTVTVALLDSGTSPPTVGSYCVGGACQVQLSSSSTMPRSYSIVIEQPIGALTRSEAFTISLDSSDPPLTEFALKPRVILKGQASCAPGLDGCENVGATIIAERLRMPGEDAAQVLRPYVFSETSLDDGHFFLPVNPGVYVLTTLPPEGQVGGPADFAIVDAREGSPDVTVSASGTPFVTVTRGTELLVGHSVRLRLNKFGSGARVLPYDLGSWGSQPDWPKDEEGVALFDLNLPETCYSGAQRGCVIRQINAGIRPLATSRAEFTVRSRGSSACP